MSAELGPEITAEEWIAQSDWLMAEWQAAKKEMQRVEGEFRKVSPRKLETDENRALFAQVEATEKRAGEAYTRLKRHLELGDIRGWKTKVRH